MNNNVFVNALRGTGTTSYEKVLEKAGAGIKKKGKQSIAPLQPPTLASFRTWGSSVGAGRTSLPGVKITKNILTWSKMFFDGAGIVFLRAMDTLPLYHFSNLS